MHRVVVSLESLLPDLEVAVDRLSDDCTSSSDRAQEPHGCRFTTGFGDFHHRDGRSIVDEFTHKVLKKRHTEPEPLTAEDVPDREVRWEGVDEHREELGEDGQVLPVPLEPPLFDREEASNNQHLADTSRNDVVERRYTGVDGLDVAGCSDPHRSEDLGEVAEDEQAIEGFLLDDLVDLLVEGADGLRLLHLLLGHAEPAERDRDECIST